jgi:hypothetical protein
MPEIMADVEVVLDDEEETSPSRYCNKLVNVIISPALFKSGNNDGQQDDKEYAVEKAEVSCVTHWDPLPLGTRPGP